MSEYAFCKSKYLTNAQLMGQNIQNYLLLVGTEHLPKHFNYCNSILKAKTTFDFPCSLFFFTNNRKITLKSISYMCRREMLGSWKGCDQAIVSNSISEASTPGLDIAKTNPSSGLFFCEMKLAASGGHREERHEEGFSLAGVQGWEGAAVPAASEHSSKSSPSQPPPWEVRGPGHAPTAGTSGSQHHSAVGQLPSPVICLAAA